MQWFRRGGFCLFFLGAASTAVLFGSALPAVAAPVIWQGNTSGAWGTGSNWDTGTVPTSGDNAYLPQGPAPGTKTIGLGAGAVANFLFVEDTGYTAQSGDLTLTDQLWIQQTGGAGLTLAASGTITAVNATLGADAGKSGSLTVSAPAGASLVIPGAGALTIGNQGTGSVRVGAFGEFPGSTLTAGTIQMGVGSSSSGNTMSVWQSVTTSNFIAGVAGGSNAVSINYAGSLVVSGNSDVVLGSGATSNGNSLTMNIAASLSASKNVVVGYDGSSNSVAVTQGGFGPGSQVTSQGIRLGVNAGSHGNSVTVDGPGSSWTTNGQQAIYVGVSGSNNTFSITGGGVLTVGGTDKNVYVGSGAATSNGNALVVNGSGSKLVMSGANADLVVSGTNGQTGNVVQVVNGGLLDVKRTIVGYGGTLTGNGTVNGPVLVGTGGVVAPGGAGGVETIGTLTLSGSLDLAPSLLPGQYGRLDIDIAGSQIDQISVTGLLNIAGSTLHFDTASWDGQTHVLATYGSINGVFGTVEGLPSGSYLDYAFGGNQIALVAAVPEIGVAGLGGVLAMVGGALGLLERRRKRA